MRNVKISMPDSVETALENGKAVVTLESTVISHGLPWPINIETARSCEDAVIDAGAVPATIGIVDGVPAAGLGPAEMECFAKGKSPDGEPIEKVNLSNMGAVIRRQGWGATTVAGSMRITYLAGSRGGTDICPLVFSTGGIGGVHRGSNVSHDVSADLTALAQLPLVCVCAGAKAILDLPATLEYLETMGVPVIGYGTGEFPAFYSGRSGLKVDATARSAEEAAGLAMSHWQSGGRTAVLVCVPVPGQFELPPEVIEPAVQAAIDDAAREGIGGKALTPYLLSRLEELTGGKSLETNRALLVNNARVAAGIALALAGSLGG